MKKAILSIGLVLLLSFTPIKAEIITIGLTGLVDYVDDPYNLLQGSVSVDNPITGYYTYESTTPDTNPSSTVGDYWHYSAPAGVSLTVGGYTFKTDLSDVKFLMEVVNNHSSMDNYLFGSYNNLSLSNGVPVMHVSWQLDDYSGTALSSTDLPTTAPVLADWQYDYLHLSGGYSEPVKQEFLITGHVISVQLIPEPATLILLMTGGLLLNRKRFKKR
jgi:hypothetical protein